MTLLAIGAAGIDMSAIAWAMLALAGAAAIGWLAGLLWRATE